MLRGKRWWVIPGAAIVLMLLLTQVRPSIVSAQCGTQASSCKNCHEVQAKAPVNGKGAWHTDHAFGDFCEFCHAGNVQATDKTAAHQGLIAWNADVKASCASCHTADSNQRAQTYATSLGVALNTGGGGSGSKAAAAQNATGACAPQGGEVIDFNLLYAEQMARSPLVSNWGNLVLGMMTMGLGVVFFGVAWTWEGWGQKVARWIRNNVTPVTEAVAAVSKRAGNPESLPPDVEKRS